MPIKNKELSDVFPIRAVEHDCLVSKWGDITVCFALTLPELFTLNARLDGTGNTRTETGDYRELVETWAKAVGVLPVQTIVHKQDWFTEETYGNGSREPDSPPVAVTTFLDKASETHFNERPYLHHNCYLFLTKTHDERREVSSPVTTLARGRILPKQISDRRRMDEFFNAVEQFVSVLESSRHVRLRRMTGSELAGTPEKPGLLERYMSLSLRDAVVPLADLEMGEELRVGNKFARYYTIADVDDLPEWVYTHSRVDALSTDTSTVSVGFAAPVSLMLHANHIYNQYLFIDDKQVVFPQLEQRSLQMRSLSGFSKKNEVNAGLISQFLDYAAATGYPPIRAHFNLLVWTEDKSMLPVLRHRVTSAITRMGVRPRENAQDAPLLFWGGIPGNASDLPREDTFRTFIPQAVCLLNQETATADGQSAFGVRLVDRLSGKPIQVDLSDVPMKKGWVTNRNKFILGPTGSGKSFLTNHLLRSYHTHGSHVVIVDVGDSYQGLCAMLGGTYLTYKPEAPIRFNPFMIAGRQRPDIEKLEAIKSLLLSLWKRSEESLTRLEETALSLSVNGYFDLLTNNPAIRPCFDTYYEYLAGNYRDRLNREGITDRHFDYSGFMIVLKPFYAGGEYDYLLNSPENIDLTGQRLVVFELDNIKDNKILFPVVTIIIMDTFITKMRTLKGIRKIILIEEAWKAIMKAEMAEYIKYLYKTVRKFFGEAWIVTQDVEDIVGSPIVKDAIINNADTKILLDQRKHANKFGQVQTLLALTDKDKDLCLSVNRDLDPKRAYKEVFVCWGGQRSAVYGVEVSLEEYLAFSTEESEKIRLQQKVARHGGSYEVALREYADEIRAARR